MNQIRDLAEALVDALDKECMASFAVLPWKPDLRRGQTNGPQPLCLPCLLDGLVDRLVVHPNPEAQALGRELLLLKGKCDGGHSDCC